MAIAEKFKRGERIYVNTEELNSRGFRLLSRGIILDRFSKNPVMTYNHIRSSMWSEKVVFPVGAWEDWRIEEDGRLSAVPVFNTDYEYGALAAQMYEDGFLNTASVHVRILEVSERPEVLVQGQTRPTVTMSELYEIAVTDIPENGGCYKVSLGAESVLLSAEEDKLEAILPKIKTNIEMDTKILAMTLGMENADKVNDTELLAAVTKLAQTNRMMTDKVNALEAKLAAQEQEAVNAKLSALLDGAIAAGKITAAQRPAYEALAAADYDNVKTVLDAMPAYTPPSTEVAAGSTGGGGATATEALAARYMELDKAGKLGSLPATERETLAAAYLAHKGRIKRNQAQA